MEREGSGLNHESELALIQSHLEFSLKALSSSGGLARGAMTALVVRIARAWDVDSVLSPQVSEVQALSNAFGEPLFLLGKGTCGGGDS
jgi:hypothetical protein